MIQSNSLWGGDARGGGGGGQRQQFQNPGAQWLFSNMLRQQMGPGLRAMPGQQPQVPYQSLMSILYGNGGGQQGMDQRKRGRFDPNFGIPAFGRGMGF